MKRENLRFLWVLSLLLALCLFCTGCGGEEDWDDAIDSSFPNGVRSDTVLSSEESDYTAFAGIWLAGAQYDYDYIEIHADGEWRLYRDGALAVSGWLRYEPEWECVYAYNAADGSGSPARLEEGELYLAAYGYFSYVKGAEDDWYADGGAGGQGDWDPAEADISELVGAWYLDGDLGASVFIVIDSDGRWSYFERAVGESEAREMDSGLLRPSEDEASTYYADSSVYAGVAHRVFDFDTGVMLWDGDMYEQVR